MFNQVVESDASRAARDDAKSFGNIAGSSYTEHEGRPVLWAFDIDRQGGDRLSVAGAEHLSARVVVRAGEPDAFSAMIFAKAVAAQPENKVVPHAVVNIGRAARQAEWHCESFYLSRAPYSECADRDVVAVGLHALEGGLMADDALRAVSQRVPNLETVRDPSSHEPGFPQWCSLVIKGRRVIRMKELGAPASMIDDVADVFRASLAKARLGDYAKWPDDLVDLVEDCTA